MPTLISRTAPDLGSSRAAIGSPRHRRVLVLDGQTNQALACVRSLGRAEYDVLVASDRRWPLAAWSRHCTDGFRLAGETLAAFAQLREWAARAHVDVVLPLTERSCVLCDAERAAWTDAGITVGCAPAETLLEAFDKSRLIEQAEAFGVAVPPTELPHSLAACHLAAEIVGFPCVVKARSNNVLTERGFIRDPGPAYVASHPALERAVLARCLGNQWPLIQGWVPGRGKGVFALCDRGRVVAWFAHERLRDVQPSGSGSSLRRSAPIDARLQAPAERLLGALRWHGPAMLEFRDDGVHAPWLIEVNGRFWGSLALAIAAGVDFPLLWLRLLLGETLDGPPAYREGVTVRWLWGDVKRFLLILRGRPAGFPAPYPSRARGLWELVGPQPAGTRIETWDRTDPWPAVGEWAEGLRELVARIT
ncbi:MAG TPA: ATP-grasp domain-containing protein [Gemmatimonadales bacterium]|nr:ATP-grasp domain-containing protein [Gemmatimonadales bacterium]